MIYVIRVSAHALQKERKEMKRRTNTNKIKKESKGMEKERRIERKKERQTDNMKGGMNE